MVNGWNIDQINICVVGQQKHTTCKMDNQQLKMCTYNTFNFFNVINISNKKKKNTP